VAGLAGVLLTRGHPTMLYPESVLTFRVEAPITISTTTAPQAFRWVRPGDYDQPYDRPMRGPRYGPGYNYGSYSYAYPSPYGYYGPGYWGPSIYFGGYWGRGWRWR